MRLKMFILNRNLFFISFTLIINLFIGSGVHSKQLSYFTPENFNQVEFIELSKNKTNSANSNKIDKKAKNAESKLNNTAHNATKKINTTAHNVNQANKITNNARKANTTPHNATSTQSNDTLNKNSKNSNDEKGKEVTGKKEEDKKLEDENKKKAAQVTAQFENQMNANSKKIEQLEKAVKQQQDFSKEMKNLLHNVKNLRKSMNITEKHNTKIILGVEKLKIMYKELDYKVTSSEIQTDNKMNMINEKLSRQLKNQLSIQEFNLQKEINDIEDNLKKLNTKLKEIKSKLPNSDSLCAKFTSCTSCTTNPSCGWCSISQQCVEGSAAGPKDGSCTFFDYNSCSGPIDCTSYTKCNDCIKDISCGWCDNPGNPVCMEKEKADQGSCKEDRYIHLWKSLNICPHIDINNLKNKLLNDLDQNNLKTPKTKNPFDIDPVVKKQLTAELKVYQEEKTKKENMLSKLMQALKAIQQQEKLMDNQNLKMNLTSNNEDEKKKFFEASKSLFGMLKNYLYQYTNQLTAQNKLNTNQPSNNKNSTNITNTTMKNQSNSNVTIRTKTTNETIHSNNNITKISNKTQNETIKPNKNNSTQTNKTKESRHLTNSTQNTTKRNNTKRTNTTITSTKSNNTKKANRSITQNSNVTKNSSSKSNKTSNKMKNTGKNNTNKSGMNMKNSTNTTHEVKNITNKNKEKKTKNATSTKNVGNKTSSNTTAKIHANNSTHTENKNITHKINATNNNQTRQLLQLSVDFGVDKSTFVNSFAEINQKELKNLRQSKIIIL